MSKKGAKNQKEPSSYELRDIVLAKVRGFPPWPGMIVDPETVPETVRKEHPSNKKATWYCVRFFPTGDYAWLVPKDISKLQMHEIEAYINEPYKKSGDLLTGYQVARDPTKWEEERNAAALQAEEENANAEVDQLASEDEEEDKLAKSKKRKRESEMPSGKSKSKTKKKELGESAGKKKTSAANKGSSRSKALVESEDDAEHDGAEADHDAGPSKKTISPPTKKSKKDKDGDEEVDPAVANDPEAKKVREWRHQLQKTFLSVKAQPKDEDMPAVDALFTAIEQYDGMSIACLQFSKIGKVMRHITSLPPEKVPRDDQFNFKQRASALVDRWHQILSANKSNGNTIDVVAAKDDGETPQINGASVDAMPIEQHHATGGAVAPASTDGQMLQA